MIKKKIAQRLVILSLFLLITSICFALETAEIEKIDEYLRSTVNYTNEIIIGSSDQEVLGFDLLAGMLAINLGDPYNDAPIIQAYFIKSGKEMLPFQSYSEVLTSSAFLESLKEKDFKLTTEKNGIAFQSILCKIDNERPHGFFKIENNWYFIRSEFFDDISAYLVTTNDAGEVISIEYQTDMLVQKPEAIMGEGKPARLNSKTSISEDGKESIYDYLINNTDYSFEITEFESSEALNISSASFYDCSMKYTEVYPDGVQCSTNYTFILLKSNEAYTKCRNGQDVICSDQFLASLENKFSIKTEEDAKLFEVTLDALDPITSNSNLEYKDAYLKDGIWFFVREESFGDPYGYYLKGDEKGTPAYLQYSSITDEDILSFKMKDENFEVHYNFTLVKPTENSITLKNDEYLDVQIDFDADMANAKGAWILTRFDGENMGMMAGTTIESPFTDKVPGPELSKGNHILEYYLLESGGTDIENPLGVVEIKVKIK